MQITKSEALKTWIRSVKATIYVRVDSGARRPGNFFVSKRNFRKWMTWRSKRESFGAVRSPALRRDRPAAASSRRIRLRHVNKENELKTAGYVGQAARPPSQGFVSPIRPFAVSPIRPFAHFRLRQAYGATGLTVAKIIRHALASCIRFS